MLTSDGGITGNPADFIVDAAGRIAFAHYGRHYADSLTIGQLADVLRGLERGQLRLDASVFNTRDVHHSQQQGIL